MEKLTVAIRSDDAPAVLESLAEMKWEESWSLADDSNKLDDTENSRIHYNPLLEAVQCRSHRVIRDLLKKYPSIVKSDSGILHAACQNKDEESLRLLLEAGADPNSSNNHEHQFPPLLTLTDTCSQSIACRRVLLQHGANPNATFHGDHTLLHWDCLRPSLEAASILLEFGASANHKPLRGTVPSHIAYWTRNLDLGQLLKRHGATFGAFYEVEMYKTIEAYLDSGDADVEACGFDGLGLLHVCAYSLASVDQDTADHLVEIALKNKINLNLPCQRERSPTALMIACGVGNVSFALALLKYCPECQSKLDDQGNTSIFYAVGSIVNTKSIMETLVKTGADVNITSSLSRAPIHEGALFYYTDPSNLKSLIDLGANIDAKDSQGWSALHYSCLPGLEGNLSSARVLLENGANVNIPDDLGRTPLHFCAMDACRNIRREMVRLPIERFYTSWVPARDDGDVQFDLVQLLLRYGADPVALDEKGNLPFFYLCKDEQAVKSNLSCIFVLIEAASHCGLF